MDVATTADWARFYAHVGFRSFPVKPGAKSPSFSNWQADATVDPKLIDQYWHPTSDRNLGLVTGESFDAWDIEGEHIARFSTWCWQNGHGYPDHFPPAPIASTGRGGLHILTAPTGIDATRRLYLDGAHIGELKSRGGFIVACPSEVTYSDAVGDYLWINLPSKRPLPEAPDWLLGLVQRPEAPRKMVPWRSVSLAPKSDLAPLLKAVRQTPEGDRNANLHWAANRACDDGIPFEMAEREMLAAYMEIIGPDEIPYEREHEGRATIASAYKR